MNNIGMTYRIINYKNYRGWDIYVYLDFLLILLSILILKPVYTVDCVIIFIGGSLFVGEEIIFMILILFISVICGSQ